MCELAGDRLVSVMSLVQRLARHVASIQWSKLGTALQVKAKQAVLDGAGAMLAGSRSEEVERLLEAFPAVLTHGVPVYGTRLRLSASDAILVNATSAHACEVDDFGGSGHPGAVVVPTVINLAETHGGTGVRLLESLVAGYDVGQIVSEVLGGYRVHNDRGWHSTGTCGSFAAAAAASRLLELNEEETSHALAIAGSFMGGIWAFADDGAMTKRLHAGRAAANGVTSAMMAAAGMTGPQRLFEAEWGGVIPLYGPTEPIPQTAADKLWQAGCGLTKSGFKPYGCCRGIHYAVDALEDILRGLQSSVDDVEQVLVKCPPRQVRQMGNNRIKSALDAQMSMPYALATYLVHSRLPFSSFQRGTLGDDKVVEALGRIDIREDRRMASEDKPLVTVILRNGERMSAKRDIALGDPKLPLSQEFLEDKFRELAQAALSKEQVEELVRAVESLDRSDTASRNLSALLVPRS